MIAHSRSSHHRFARLYGASQDFFLRRAHRVAVDALEDGHQRGPGWTGRIRSSSPSRPG